MNKKELKLNDVISITFAGHFRNAKVIKVGDDVSVKIIGLGDEFEIGNKEWDMIKKDNE